MSQHYIKYPIAYNREQNRIVHISEVAVDDRRKLICLDCKENFVAVLNHRTKHFKHKPNSKCDGDVESYIHWVTKEVFKEIQEIELPELLIDNLTEDYKKTLETQVNDLIQKSVPEKLQLKFRSNLKKNISNSIKISIDNLEIEEKYKTAIGGVRVDVVAFINNRELFIEPFFTSPIDEMKKAKLALLNTPTIAINLLKFIQMNGSDYTIDGLKYYLIDKNCKTWIFNRNCKIKNHIAAYIKYVQNEIENNQEEYNQYKSKLNLLSELENLELKLREKIRPALNEIDKTRNKIFKIRKELGFNDFDY